MRDRLYAHNVKWVLVRNRKTRQLEYKASKNNRVDKAIYFWNKRLDEFKGMK